MNICHEVGFYLYVPLDRSLNCLFSWCLSDVPCFIYILSVVRAASFANLRLESLSPFMLFLLLAGHL